MSAQGENKITLEGVGLGAASESDFDGDSRRVLGPLAREAVPPHEAGRPRRSTSGAHPRREAMLDSLAYRPTLLDASVDAALGDEGPGSVGTRPPGTEAWAALDTTERDLAAYEVDDLGLIHVARSTAEIADALPLGVSRGRITEPAKDSTPEERQQDGKPFMNPGRNRLEPTPRDTLRDAVRMSSGYYSRTDSQVEAVEIPRAPRVPKIEDLDGPLPKTPTSKPVTVRRDSSGVRRVMIAAALRRQADVWLATGSLELPTTASPRHARAKQRALLVALLMEPGFDALPLGLQQRATWLFRTGWALGAGERDADDCAACLGFEPLAEIRTNLVLAIEAALPEHLLTAPPPSSQRPESLRPPAERPTTAPPPRVTSAAERPTSRPPAVARTTRPPARRRGE